MLSRRHFLPLGLAALATTAQAAAPRKIVASFSILGDLVRELTGTRPAVLVGPDQDAHVFQPRPSDLRAVAAADLLVVNGLGFEGWMDRLAQSAGFRGRIIVASDGIAPRTTPDGQTDPHAFQSVPNIKRYITNIAAALPADAARTLIALDALDAEIRAAWAPIPRTRRRIITTHDALGYYGAEYGVDFLAPVGLSTESEPSAKQLRSLIDQIKQQNIAALFLENISNGALLRQIAREAQVTVGATLYSDALSQPNGAAGTYIAMMRYNTKQMVAAVK